MTREEKIKLADELRVNRLVEIVVPEKEKRYKETVSIEQITVKNQDMETKLYMIRPKGKCDKLPLYINLHGGGFIRGYTDESLLFCCKMASEAECAVLDIDYKTAPEDPYPAAFDECCHIVEWAFENSEKLKIDPGEIALGGHSAGGNLTAAIAMRLNKNGKYRICQQLLDYAPLDLATDPAEKEGIYETLIPYEVARCYNEFYRSESQKDDIYVSPVMADRSDLKGLPHTLIISAGKDNLRFEDFRFGRMLVEAGVQVLQKCFLSSGHGFMLQFREEYEEGHKLYIKTLRDAFYNRGENVYE